MLTAMSTVGRQNTDVEHTNPCTRKCLQADAGSFPPSNTSAAGACVIRRTVTLPNLVENLQLLRVRIWPTIPLRNHPRQRSLTAGLHLQCIASGGAPRPCLH